MTLGAGGLGVKRFLLFVFDYLQEPPLRFLGVPSWGLPGQAEHRFLLGWQHSPIDPGNLKLIHVCNFNQKR